MQRARVIAAHRVPDRPAIRVSAGDAVTLGERDGEWPQLVWATLSQGLGGGIPAVLFDGQGGTATALEDYDTRELAADPDEIRVLHREQAGWRWAQNAAGHSGWIPARAVEPLQVADTA
ncbi:MAG: SH3 domain-containing protein [Pseudoxanthomonas sp.]|nr:SH3 domain-containing protein [Pseudoxanthomonas sp.]